MPKCVTLGVKLAGSGFDSLEANRPRVNVESRNGSSPWHIVKPHGKTEPNSQGQHLKYSEKLVPYELTNSLPEADSSMSLSQTVLRLCSLRVSNLPAASDWFAHAKANSMSQQRTTMDLVGDHEPMSWKVQCCHACGQCQERYSVPPLCHDREAFQINDKKQSYPPEN